MTFRLYVFKFTVKEDIFLYMNKDTWLLNSWYNAIICKMSLLLYLDKMKSFHNIFIYWNILIFYYFILLLIHMFFIKYSIGNQCFKTSGPGPHPTSCLIAWWLEAGCSINGEKSPTVNAGQRDYWNSFNVDVVKADMSAFYRLANGGSRGYESSCFGNWRLYQMQNENIYMSIKNSRRMNESK